MKEICYSNGQRMNVGDRVRIHRRVFPDLIGEVMYVHDPHKALIPKGDNEYGFSIQLETGACRWYGGQVPEEVRFELRRGGNQ